MSSLWQSIDEWMETTIMAEMGAPAQSTLVVTDVLFGHNWNDDPVDDASNAITPPFILITSDFADPAITDASLSCPDPVAGLDYRYTWLGFLYNTDYRQCRADAQEFFGRMLTTLMTDFPMGDTSFGGLGVENIEFRRGSTGIYVMDKKTETLHTNNVLSYRAVACLDFDVITEKG